MKVMGNKIPSFTIEHMMTNKALKVLCFSLLGYFTTGGYSFTPTPILSGPMGEHLTLKAIPRSIAYKYIRGTQIEYIKQDCSRAILDEMNDARELLRDPKSKDWHVSVVIPKSTNKNTFMVVYRMNNRFPACYTVEALIRNHVIEPGNGSMSVMDLQNILDQMVKNRRGHLQIYPLKTWARGRYLKELEVEKRFLSNTFDLETLPGSHSDDQGDFRNFGGFI